MRGLLYKEYCMMKSQYRSWAFAFLILGAYAVILKDPSMLSIVTAMMGIMCSLTTFSYDRMYHCDEFVAAMPVGRNQIVLSKYAFLFLLDFTLAAVSAAIYVALSLLSPVDLGALLASAAGILGATMFLQSVILPLIYLLGPEKARLCYMLLGLLPCALLVLWRDRLPAISESQFFGFVKLFPLFLIFLIVISAAVSMAVYRKKEF